MDFVIIGLLVVVIILVLVDIVIKKNKQEQVDFTRLDDKFKNNIDLVNSNNNLLFEKLNIKFDALDKNIKELENNFNQTKELLNTKLEYLLVNNHEANNQIKEKLSLEIKEFDKSMNLAFRQLKEDVNNDLEKIRKDNSEKIDKINETVNEKLEKTLEGKLKQSFDTVVEQIGGVNKAIGEIKGLANDVGSLKKVLTNVKTKGIVGEVILGNIIREILVPNQYEENIITKANSKDPVEFAVKMPNGDGFIYLPIDSKFPLESYHKIKDAMEAGDADALKENRKHLAVLLKTFAKQISDKYIDITRTTDFGIMFLPIEGLYIEALELGLFEEIQREYKVTLAGPTTLTAILNSLQMGFKTLAIQQKSADVFKLLEAIKTEFNRFAQTLEKTQKKIGEAGSELDALVGTRTKKIQSKLKNITEISYDDAKLILDDEE